MRPYILFCPDRGEAAALSSVLNFLMKKRGISMLPAYTGKLDQLKSCMEDPGQLKLLICDVTVKGVVPVLEALRSANPELKLVLLADGTVSPVTYIRPTVLPTALLWRPLGQEETRKTLWEVLASIPSGEEAGEQTDDGSFSVEVRGDLRRIPYSQILFFEAGNKRLNLHMQRKEIPFSGTLEKLEQELPDSFIRVHKSFIINRMAIREIQYGQNQVILEGDIPIPISRSYKPALKAVFA